jgi:hypothetical protein
MKILWLTLYINSPHKRKKLIDVLSVGEPPLAVNPASKVDSVVVGTSIDFTGDLHIGASTPFPRGGKSLFIEPRKLTYDKPLASTCALHGYRYF